MTKFFLDFPPRWYKRDISMWQKELCDKLFELLYYNQRKFYANHEVKAIEIYKRFCL